MTGAQDLGPDLSQLPAHGVYVVEVFTSQGCSSCPPADDALSALSAQAEAAGVALHVLAWHVDYWDYLGWPDPYASAAASQRQRAYARRMRRTTVYTPQVLVNGAIEVENPYRAATILPAVRLAAESAQPVVNIEVRSTVADGRITVAYLWSDAMPITTGGSGHNIGVLVVEDGIVTTPARGENAGRRLINNHVVRAARFARLRSSGEVALDIPAGANRERSDAIVIVQSRRTHEIVFAQAVGL